MESIILNCLQAQLIFARINDTKISKETKNDLIWEVKQITPKSCKVFTDKGI